MYREPITESFSKTEFIAVWEAIKEWDINVLSEYKGYCGATGNHVMAIMDSLKEMRKRAE